VHTVEANYYLASTLFNIRFPDVISAVYSIPLAKYRALKHSVIVS